MKSLHIVGQIPETVQFGPGQSHKVPTWVLTLKRDELLRDGREDEFTELVEPTRDLQKSILDGPGE